MPYKPRVEHTNLVQRDQSADKHHLVLVFDGHAETVHDTAAGGGHNET